MLVCLNRKPSSTLLNKIKSKLAREVSTAKSIALPSPGSGGKLWELELGSRNWGQLCSHKVVPVMWFCDTAPGVLST